MKKTASYFILFIILIKAVSAQDAAKEQRLEWFRDAKFGLFMHWGLYAQLQDEWQGKRYYGISEWLMKRAKIPAKEYEQTAKNFNPVNFNAQSWASFAKDAGFKYLIITAKHHDGFAMFGSKASAYNIVDATPYHKDPMKALSEACRQQGIRFGFYYSQFLDWHEPNGGGNNWDFDDKKKNYDQYFKTKSIPQVKELLKNYGPLSIVWFDMPGNLSKRESQDFLDMVHRLQPQCLVSSRVGNGLGDYKDYGDGEVPAGIVKGDWEALFTHNDSWGYSATDHDFKTPGEIIRLLATVASKGGNLLLNIGPDGKGNLPPDSKKFLLEVGQWLKINGEAIYGTTYSPIQPQPWGVLTAKPGTLFLHVFEKPRDGKLMVPGITGKVTRASLLDGHVNLSFSGNGNDLLIQLPQHWPDSRDAVIKLTYTGVQKESYMDMPLTVSEQYAENDLLPEYAKLTGKAKIESMTSSRYFGDWRHSPCIRGMSDSTDKISFQLRVTDPGDYRLLLEYSCNKENAKQEGLLEWNKEPYYFETLYTGEYDSHRPLMFIRHSVGIVHADKPGLYSISIRPVRQGKELFLLKKVILQPVR